MIEYVGLVATGPRLHYYLTGVRTTEAMRRALRKHKDLMLEVDGGDTKFFLRADARAEGADLEGVGVHGADASGDLSNCAEAVEIVHEEFVRDRREEQPVELLADAAQGTVEGCREFVL